MPPLSLRGLIPMLCGVTLLGDLPGERILRAPETPPEAGGGGGGGGDGGEPTAFSQEQVDQIVQRRIAAERKKYGDYDNVKAQAERAAQLEAQVAELNERIELAGKSEKDREKLLAEKLTAKLEKDRADFAAQAEAAKAEAAASAEALKRTRLEYQITGALSTAKALPSALKFAVPAMLAEGEFETDDAGRITGIALDGVPYKDLGAAAEAYLKANPLFLAAPPGGAGSRAPNGAPAPADWRDMSPEEMAQLAWSKPPST